MSAAYTGPVRKHGLKIFVTVLFSTVGNVRHNLASNVFAQRSVFLSDTTLYYASEHYTFRSEAGYPQVLQCKGLNNKIRNVNNFARSHK
jgi:hypothetical protein